MDRSPVNTGLRCSLLCLRQCGVGSPPMRVPRSKSWNRQETCFVSLITEVHTLCILQKILEGTQLEISDNTPLRDNPYNILIQNTFQFFSMPQYT